MDFLGGGFVLDQLDQLILVDDLSRRGRDIDPKLEGLGVGHGDAQVPVAALDVVEKVIEALDQVLPARGDGFAEDFWIGQREIGRRQRIDVLAGEEIHLFLRVLVEPFNARHRIVQPSRGDQVRLLHVVEQKMLLPILVLEALVALGGFDHGCGRMSEQPEHRRLPQGRVIPEQIELRLSEQVRIRQQLGGELEKRLGETEFVARERGAGGGVARHIIAEQFGALVSGAGE